MINLKFLKMPMFAFFLIMIFVLICIIIYKILGPEPPGSWNYVPFPSMSPKDLPDANSSQKTCYTNLTACDGPGICSTCGEENFECVDVLTDTQYVLNNIKVPKGNWCLPKKQEQSCGTYTGKWVWSSGNCPDGKSQCWKCECLYPDLYGGDDCMVQKACLNHSPHAKTSDQTNNILTGTTDGHYPGVKWDPVNLDPQDNTVLTVNPYTSTVDGKPWFKCNCDKSYININLPGDPYSCHVDPCWEYDGYTFSGAICDDNNCTCNCTENGGFNVLDGFYKDRCISNVSVCTNGTIDSSTQECNCSGIYTQQKCISTNFSRTGQEPPARCTSTTGCIGDTVCDINTGWCKCSDDKNPIGDECLQKCTPGLCQNGGTTKISTTGDCSCDCDGSTSLTTPDAVGDSRKGHYGGTICATPQYEDCTILQVQTTIAGNHVMHGVEADKKYCESGKMIFYSKTGQDYWWSCGANQC